MRNERLAQAFASGTLLHPVSDLPGFVDLTRALGGMLGHSSSNSTPNQARIADFIGGTDHLVFVLVDGMGSTLLELLPPDAFLRSQRMTELRAVYPSTTACALTTLATGLWPAQHGVPVWWSYVEERSLSVRVLQQSWRLEKVNRSKRLI